MFFKKTLCAKILGVSSKDQPDQMSQADIILDDIISANDNPLVLLGGVNVLEDLDFVLRCSKHYKDICRRLKISLDYTSSYDKANHSSIHSFRGPGHKQGREILKRLGHPRHSDEYQC